MKKDELLKLLWNNYTLMTPSAKHIHQIFEEKGEQVLNDHIALRTFNDPRVNIQVIAKPFIELGYVEKGEYKFKEKKLLAHHYEHQDDKNAPKIFISELLLEQCSNELQHIVSGVIDQIPNDASTKENLLLQGRLWDISFDDYEILRKESEYASWMYVFGFCANHFTVLVNGLKTLRSLEEVNDFLKSKNFKLNDAGGEIKGTSDQFLQQSSTIADQVPVHFNQDIKNIPSCYYEFARRYPLDDGNLYQGFIAASADKIFESTNVSLVDKILSKNQ
ncbi:DUF1338 domain-containing protein [Arcticibacter eurypsychrophilus]|uniref:DUF1338 domain-containing protein n=1 Tax=Arcticibacter eurypsychrophilus TaxID=1434752 RepID=UPI00084D60C6|nr:DUF1338 domain-containing protein [Arcticibacter eurypsychrophilus]